MAHQDRHAEECVEVENPQRGLGGLGRNRTRCDHPASRQKASSNFSATFSYRPKPSRRTASTRSGGSGGPKLGRSCLSTPSGTATTTCEPVSVLPDVDVTKTPRPSAPPVPPASPDAHPARPPTRLPQRPTRPRADPRSSCRRTRPASTTTAATGARPHRLRPPRHRPEAPAGLVGAPPPRALSWPGTPRFHRLPTQPARAAYATLEAPRCSPRAQRSDSPPRPQVTAKAQ